MDILQDYKIIEENQKNYLILYINPYDTEFANEFFSARKEEIQDLKKSIEDSISKNYSKIKIHGARIMIGTILVSSIPIEMVPLQITQETNINNVHAQSFNRFNMSYLYFGDPINHASLVHRTGQSLQVVAPSYFDLDAEGNLVLSSLLNPSFIQEMHNHDITVVPFLSNHWDRAKGIAALENREQLVDDIVYAINTYNLDGINVDIENVTHEQKDLYTDLVKQLRERLPQDKEVSVAVAANPKGWTTGWHGSYDYAELGKYADYLMIMSYDESYYGSQPGPVASQDFIESSIQYALQHVEPEKVVMGIGFFGRYWKEGEQVGGNGIHLTKVQELIDTYESTVTYDKNSQSAKAEITVKPNDPQVNLFGKVLDPGNYTIWYENDESIKSKLTLVDKYNIKGTGSWSLGQELENVWSYYDLWLNSKYFEDIDRSWAKDDIIAMINKQWMQGVSDKEFAPTGTLTRAQAATVLVRALNLEDKGQQPIIFSDVSISHWAKEYINIIVQHGIMQGISEEEFSPNTPLTREQMAMVLYRSLEVSPSSQSINYNDVESGRWSEEAIKSMNEKGVFKGYPDETFKPNKSMERQEMAAVMNRISNDINQ